MGLQNQCQNQKNTVDPENIISNYGADAARLFILSDSPPEKDVQWSEEGIASAYKFIQKLWNLNTKVLNEINKNHTNDTDDSIEIETNKFIKKFTENIENFSYNKLIANLHEIHSFFNKRIEKIYKKETLIENYEKILITINPIIPHFSNECLSLINSKNFSWPKYDKSLVEEKEIIIVIQINGKKRGIIKTKTHTIEEELMKMIEQEDQIKKYLVNKEIKRKIYIKDKLLNIII